MPSEFKTYSKRCVINKNQTSLPETNSFLPAAGQETIVKEYTLFFAFLKKTRQSWSKCFVNEIRYKKSTKNVPRENPLFVTCITRKRARGLTVFFFFKFAVKSMWGAGWN